MPGCPALGLCEAPGHGPGHLYALSSANAVDLFSEDPDGWLERALVEVRRRPALVGLLGLVDALAPPTPGPAWSPRW